MRLLYLEDNRLDVELLKMRCSELPGYELLWVSSRAEYLSALAGAQFDGIISDSGVSDLTGLEALALARSTAPHALFVFLSGVMSQKARERVIAAGPDGVFSKDISNEVDAALAIFFR